MSALNHSVVFYTRHFTILIFKKHLDSPSFDKTHFPGASIVSLRCGREVLWAPKISCWDLLSMRSLLRDRKLLNFTHCLRRTSMKYNKFEGKYFWIYIFNKVHVNMIIEEDKPLTIILRLHWSMSIYIAVIIIVQIF